MEMIFQLGGGSDGDLQELCEIGIGCPCASLSDVRWNRECGPPHLSDQTSVVAAGNSARDAVDIERECVRLSSYQKLPVVLHKWVYVAPAWAWSVIFVSRSG